MTLIAGILDENHPMIVGDLLISSNYPPLSPLKLPTSRSGKELEFTEFYPTYLRQKIYVISNNLSIGLAGDVHQMTLFLKNIKTQFKDTLVSESQLEDFLNNIIRIDINNMAYLCLLSINCGGKYLFKEFKKGPWESKEDKFLRKVIAVGTGRDDFLTEITRFYKMSPSDEPIPLFNKLTQVQAAFTNILGLDFYSEFATKNYWGAGFEMIYFDNGRFQKLNNFTQILWYGNFNEKFEIEFTPYLMSKYRYQEDILTILSYNSELKMIPITAIPIDCENYVGRKVSLDGDNWDSIIQANSFFGRFQNGELVGMNFSEFNEPSQGFRHAFIKVDANGTEVYLSQQIRKYIIEQMINTYKSSNKN